MPVTVDFTEPSSFTLHTSGHVRCEEARLALAEVAAHPRLKPGSTMLNQAAGVTGVPSIAELCVIAADLTPLILRGLGRIAIVVPEPLLGVARTFSTFASVMNANVRVFLGLDDARRWLTRKS